MQRLTDTVTENNVRKAAGSQPQSLHMRESFPHGHIKCSSSKAPDQPGPPDCMATSIPGEMSSFSGTINSSLQQLHMRLSPGRPAAWVRFTSEAIWSVRLHRTFRFENLHALTFSCKWSSWMCNFHNCEWVSAWANKQKEKNQCCSWDVKYTACSWAEYLHRIWYSFAFPPIFVKRFFKTTRQKVKYGNLNWGRSSIHTHHLIVFTYLWAEQTGRNM